MANQIDLICALQLMSADNSSTAPNGGYSRGADKRTGYGTSSLRVWVPSWNAEFVSLSAHGSRAAREGCAAGAGMSGGLGNGADDGGAGGVVRGDGH